MGLYGFFFGFLFFDHRFWVSLCKSSDHQSERVGKKNSQFAKNYCPADNNNINNFRFSVEFRAVSCIVAIR